MIEPNDQPEVFNNSNDVVTALKNEQIDAVVVDLPTALYVTAVQVAGRHRRRPVRRSRRRPVGRAAGEGLGADRLRLEGDRSAGSTPANWKQLNKRWMSQAAGAPELH